MGQNVAIPDWAKNGPAQSFQALKPEEDTLASGIGQSYPVISYRGKTWALRARGEKHNIIRPDGTPAFHIDVVILGASAVKSKSFFPSFDNDGSSEGPICASMNGETPDLDARQPQASACAICPRNVWKTNPQTGKKGRECTDYKRLAVVLMPEHTANMPGGPYIEPVFLRVPPASLNGLVNLGETMAGQGFHSSTYVTRINFDPNEAHPKMVFTAIKGLGEDEAPTILRLRQEPVVERIIHGDVALPSSGGIGTQGSLLSLTAAPPATPTHPPLDSSNTTNSPSMSTATAAQRQAPTGLSGFAQNANPNGNGFAPNTVSSPTPSDTTLANSTLAGVSAPKTIVVEASDDDLDARLARLASKPK